MQTQIKKFKKNIKKTINKAIRDQIKLNFLIKLYKIIQIKLNKIN